ncbi:MAG: hypothetical protein AAF664_02245, partial [Planctomycetota bacterium]
DASNEFESDAIGLARGAAAAAFGVDFKSRFGLAACGCLTDAAPPDGDPFAAGARSFLPQGH